MKPKKSTFLLSALLLVSCQSVSYMGGVPENGKKMSLQLTNREQIAAICSNDLMPFLSESAENSVCSPASYALALGGVVSASANATSFAENCGFTSEYQSELKELMNAFNWQDEDDYLHAAILHQQVGPTLAFDESKRVKLAEEYISTMVSDRTSYHKDAEEFFQKEIDLTLKIPETELEDDAIIAYAAMTLQDCFINPQQEVDNPFTLSDGTSLQVSTLPLNGGIYYYYETDQYQCLNRYIHNTSLFFVLPKDGVELDEINPYSALEEYEEKKEHVRIEKGYLPYFKASSQFDLSQLILDKNDQSMQLYENLLCDDIDVEPVLDAAVQANEFEFSSKGVKGQSVTKIIMSNLSADANDYSVVDFVVDKPFYAVSLYERFPLFISKITNPKE